MIKKSILDPCRFRPFRGNALSEYAVIGAVVIGVSLAILEMIGHTLEGSLFGLQKDMGRHEALVRAEMSGFSAGEASQMEGLMDTLGTEEARLLQQSLPEKIQTAGANGSTRVLAKQLSLLAKKLLKEGKISESQYDLLMKLSNQGYQIAKVEALVEEGIRHSKGDVNVFVETKYSFENEEHSAQMLARLVGYSGVTPTTAEGFLDGSGNEFVEPEMNEFMMLYQAVQEAGILNDPLAKSTVDSAVLQIAQIGESVEHTIYLGVEESNLPSDTTSLNGKIASVATGMNSDRICRAGNFKSNGVECSP